MSAAKDALVEALLVERFTRWEPDLTKPVTKAAARRNRQVLAAIAEEPPHLRLVHNADRRRRLA